MEITNESLPWDIEDVQIFLTFMQTVTGKRVVPKLLESAPTLLDGGDVNKTLVRNGEFRGFSDAVRALLALQNVVPAQVVNDTSNYPAPEDDAAWNDGQQLQPTN